MKGFPWNVPGEVPLTPYCVAVVIRTALGSGLAAAFAASEQIAGPLGALIVGIAAPKIVEQLMRHTTPSTLEPSSTAAEGGTGTDVPLLAQRRDAQLPGP
ncbi:hypothetical protein V1J52_18655 [Streptomyces sp. TRM 70351]|uniref:hypothetical protein n=1 Tax=Streptomyces sp. TRM 70351 TaxID=3116552 RepID=UPI002E7B7D8A|nr:hypothetical protein [Streptomyces sp. TRM 70351]MEE1930182.1 hypothetical protein [Streptomyces sp. TRM 70351]